MVSLNLSTIPFAALKYATTPIITTVKIPSSAMGFIAAEHLLSRISHPDTAYRTTYIKTDIIYRESTRNLK